MGFRHLINSKKTLLLSASAVLLSAGAMAQAPATGGDTAAMNTTGMWAGVGYYLLLFFVACLVVAIVGKILKVYDLTQKMQGKKGINWNTTMAVLCAVFLLVGLYGAYWSLTVQGSMTLPESASEHGPRIDAMFLTTSILTLIVFFLTQIALFGFSFFYRGSDKRKGYYLPHNNTIEKIWTIIPAVVLTVLVVFGFFTWQKVENSKDQGHDLNIDVTGRQFEWVLRYPGADNKLGHVNFKLYTANNTLGVDFKDRNSIDDIKADTLVVPVFQPVRLNIHAQDVIHSVYMPHFRLQQNAVPGLPTFFRFIPTITTEAMRRKLDDPKFEYLLYCNKICGSGHYNMQKVVRVVTPSEYQDWISKQKPYLTDGLKKELHFAENKPATQAPAVSNRLALNN